MRCEEFLQVLDSVDTQRQLPPGWAEHGASCPSCAFAMRLERTLRSAPSWWTPPAHSGASRQRLIKEIAAGVPLRVQVAALFEESVMTALLLAAAGCVLFFAAPRLWTALPDALRQRLDPFLQPLSAAAHSATAPFGPLAHHGWGIAMMAATAFVVLFAASLSLKTLAPRARAF